MILLWLSLIWEIFELPGINLEDICYSGREYSHMPNAADIGSIKNEVIQSLDKLNQKELIDDKDFEKIKSSITSLKLTHTNFLYNSTRI